MCPFYKASKYGMIGKCVGSRKVGETLLNFLISVKSKEEAEQLELFEAGKKNE